MSIARLLMRPVGAFWQFWLCAGIGALAAAGWQLVAKWDAYSFRDFAILVMLLVCSIGSFAAGIALRRHTRRAARLQACQCLQCGYDLRGNATGICPECGFVTEIGRFRRMHFDDVNHESMDDVVSK